MGSKGEGAFVYILLRSRSHDGSHVLSHALVYYYLLQYKSHASHVDVMKRVWVMADCVIVLVDSDVIGKLVGLSLGCVMVAA